MKYLSNFFLFLIVAAPIATGLHVAEHIRGSLVDADEEYTLKENNYLLNLEEDNDLDQEDADYHRQLGQGKGKGKGKSHSMSKESDSKSHHNSKSKSKGKGKGKGKGTEPSFLCSHDKHSLVV